MATILTEAFIKHYEAEVQAAYQRMGSKLRNTVRTRNNIRGSSAVFQKVGKGTAATKSAGAQIQPMNSDRRSKEVTLQNYYAGDWVDILDDMKTDSDEKMVVAQTGAYALGRQTDEIIMDALGKTNITNVVTCDGTPAANKIHAEGSLTRDKILQAFNMLGNADVPDDGQRFAVIGWEDWTDMLKIEEFSNADYVGREQLPWNGTQVKYWLGTYWIPYSDIRIKTDTTSNKHYRNLFWYHRNTIGHAVGKDITSDITWHGDHASYFVNNMMSQGAEVIDETGIVKILVQTKTEPPTDPAPGQSKSSGRFVSDTTTISSGR